MELLSYSFMPIDSRMYLLIKGMNALVVDPCVDKEAFDKLQTNEVVNVTILLTHEHYDHISGVNWFRQHFENVTVICSEECAEAIGNPTENLAAFSSMLSAEDLSRKETIEHKWDESYSCIADKTFQAEYSFIWDENSIYMKKTPGHSNGSICIIMNENVLFSGDTLVTGHKTVTKLPGGSRKLLREVTIPYLKSLDQNMLVCPGHGERQLLCEYVL